MRDFMMGGDSWLGEPETFLNEARSGRKGSILFAHGICHGAWCWTRFFDYFADRGYDCYAMSYRGHGQTAELGRRRLGKFRLSDYVDDLATVVEAIAREGGEKPFLVGHSMGGAVVQAYIDDCSEKVAGAVLYASAPAKRMRALETTAAHWSSIRLMHALGISLGMRLSLDKVNDSAFFNGGLGVEDCERYAQLLQPESWRVVCDLMWKPYSRNWQTVKCPVCVVGSSADEYFPEKLLMRTAKAYGVDRDDRRYRVFSGLCHDMMLDEKWEETAEYLLEFFDACADGAFPL